MHTSTPDDDWPSDAVRERLVGDWYLWQRRGGHRTSTDDLLTAWLAVNTARAASAAPEAEPSDGSDGRYVDLGCGIGSVLLMVAHALRPALAIGVEAQPQSVAMARRTISELDDGGALRVVHGDLREVDVTTVGGRARLVTGSPPYLPVGTGVPSPDPQRHACRFELRGGVEDYCAAAARILSPQGAFCLVFQTTWDARVREAAEHAGLFLRRQFDVKTRADRPAPLLSLYHFALEPGPFEHDAFAVRDAHGAISERYAEVRGTLGLDAR